MFNAELITMLQQYPAGAKVKLVLDDGTPFDLINIEGHPGIDPISLRASSHLMDQDLEERIDRHIAREG